MAIFYSASAGGFFMNAVNPSIPVDAVEITDKEHADCLAGQAAGLRIEVAQDGRPHLVTPTISRAVALEQLLARVQAHLDTQAAAHGYDTIATAVSYAEEPAVPQYQAEGQAFRAWRSLVWAAAHDALAADPLPAEADVIAALPLFLIPKSETSQ